MLRPKVWRLRLQLSVVAIGWLLSTSLIAEPRHVAENSSATSEGNDSPRSSAPDQPTGTDVRSALVSALHTNFQYSQEWLSGNDFKSLGQSMGGLSVLADALARYTDESGSERFSTLRTAIREVSAAARAEDPARAAMAMKALDRAVDAVAKLPARQRPAAAGRTSAGIQSLMSLVDGTFSDAKVAVAADDRNAARANLVVLDELGEWLAADRANAQWKSLAADFRHAVQDAASADPSDAKLTRAKLRAVYASCEKCHDRR